MRPFRFHLFPNHSHTHTHTFLILFSSVLLVLAIFRIHSTMVIMIDDQHFAPVFRSFLSVLLLSVFCYSEWNESYKPADHFPHSLLSHFSPPFYLSREPGQTLTATNNNIFAVNIYTPTNTTNYACVFFTCLNTRKSLRNEMGWFC